MVVREAIERSSHRSAHRHSVFLGLSKASVRRILHKDHGSGVETLNSARSHRNSCGSASKSNGDVRKRLTECLEWNCGHLNDVLFGK